MKNIGLFILIFSISHILAEDIAPGAFSITRIHYGGGGDWYADPGSLPNLLEYMQNHTNVAVNPVEKRAKIGDDVFLESSYFYLTGHGNINFSNREAQHLRDQLLAGAFLHADDNYGMDQFVRPEIKKVFPELEFVELPFTHPIYNQQFNFSDGLPKIHEHDDKPPQGFGIIHEGRLVCFYSYESDLGDGWEDQEVHKDSQNTRLSALKMGANIIQYTFLNCID